MLQTTAQSSEPGEVRMIRAEIARLRKMPALAKRIEEFEPQPDPIAQEKAMLEVEYLKAQIYNERAKGNENNANATLDEAKAITEEAKTRNIHSESDKKDLEFVEAEQGVGKVHEMNKMDHDRGTKLGLKELDNQAKNNQTSLQ